MPESELPNNSKRKAAEPDISPEVEMQIEKIITGEAISRKPSGFRRLRKSFIGGDASSVSEHVIWNMLVPAAKETISEMGSTFIDMMIFGGEKRQRFGPTSTPQSGSGSTSKFNYTAISQGVTLSPHQMQNELPPALNPNEIFVPTRAEAVGVITRMYEVLDKYGAVTVGNLYAMVGKSSNNYMDNAYGWTDLDGSDVKRVRGGIYLIVLPQPKDLNG